MKCANESCPHIKTCDQNSEHFCFIAKDKPLKDVSFTKLSSIYLGLSIFVDDKEVASGFFGEVLEKVTQYADKPVKSYNEFFDMAVIRL